MAYMQPSQHPLSLVILLLLVHMHGYSILSEREMVHGSWHTPIFLKAVTAMLKFVCFLYNPQDNFIDEFATDEESNCVTFLTELAT
jgi:hypothetical protein